MGRLYGGWASLYQRQRGRLTRAGVPSLDFSFTFADGSGDVVSGEVDGLLVARGFTAEADDGSL